jgi:Ni,Fe-hydrogenase maturation factor
MLHRGLNHFKGVDLAKPTPSHFFMKKKIIHIFGNPLLDFDNLPLKFAPKLQKLFPEIDFVIADPNENLKLVNKELIIIDTVEDTKDVALIDDIKKLQTQKLYSLHDFDLGFNLKLLQKIGDLEKIKIIGVPMKGNEREILRQLEKIISTSLSKSATRRTCRGHRRG